MKYYLQKFNNDQQKRLYSYFIDKAYPILRQNGIQGSVKVDISIVEELSSDTMLLEVDTIEASNEKDRFILKLKGATLLAQLKFEISDKFFAPNVVYDIAGPDRRTSFIRHRWLYGE
jgi:hypothetical protein